MRKCFWRRGARTLTHSLPVTFCLLVWVSNSHRPQRPAAHLPLKGRGTNFQVAAVRTLTHTHTHECIKGERVDNLLLAPVSIETHIDYTVNDY